MKDHEKDPLTRAQETQDRWDKLLEKIFSNHTKELEQSKIDQENHVKIEGKIDIFTTKKITILQNFLNLLSILE